MVDRHIVATLLGASLSDNTRIAYTHACRSFDEWRESHGIDGIDDGIVARYLAAVHEGGAATATVHVALAGIRYRQRMAGQFLDGQATRAILRGIGRVSAGRGQRQAPAIDWQAAARMALIAEETGRLIGYRDSALIRVMSDCLLRGSEVLALTVGDVAYDSDGSGRVVIRRSKTDQAGKGAVQYIGAATVIAIKTWRATSGIGEGVLFRSVTKGGAVGAGLSMVGLNKSIARWASDVGIDGASSHSFRVGSAQSLARAGASLVAMQIEGRWASPIMPAHYARHDMAARGAIARFKYGVNVGGGSTATDERPVS